MVIYITFIYIHIVLYCYIDIYIHTHMCVYFVESSVGFHS